MRLLVLPFCLLLSSCSSMSMLGPTDAAVHDQAGLIVQKSTEQNPEGTRLRVRGAPWLQGGDAGAAFRREADALARSMGCMEYRVDGRQESQENTMLGTRRVVQGTVVCTR